MRQQQGQSTPTATYNETVTATESSSEGDYDSADPFMDRLTTSTWDDSADAQADIDSETAAATEIPSVSDEGPTPTPNDNLKRRVTPSQISDGIAWLTKELVSV